MSRRVVASLAESLHVSQALPVPTRAVPVLTGRDKSASDICACAESRLTQKIPEATVFPESYITAEFWDFVQQRAYDRRNRGLYNFGPAITQLDRDRKVYQQQQPVKEAGTASPIIYVTVQEALIDFLIYSVNFSGYSLTYEIWLRTVTLVMAQGQMRPHLLTVQTPVQDPGPYNRTGEEELRPHTMQVAEHQWDCLSRDTYDYVVRTFPYLRSTPFLGSTTTHEEE
jgi:hypothetical protein